MKMLSGLVCVCVCVCVCVSPGCFNRSSSEDSRRGSKWIFWTWQSLASISCLSSYRARKHTHTYTHTHTNIHETPSCNIILYQQNTAQHHCVCVTLGALWPMGTCGPLRDFMANRIICLFTKINSKTNT